MKLQNTATFGLLLLLFPFPFVITASVLPGGTFVSMNRFSTLCG
jgi:hypothetical protein